MLVRAEAEQTDNHFANMGLDDTARWCLRADYVLPSADLTVTDSGVWRPSAQDESASDLAVSDHFPVWVDVRLKGE